MAAQAQTEEEQLSQLEQKANALKIHVTDESTPPTSTPIESATASNNNNNNNTLAPTSGNSGSTSPRPASSEAKKYAKDFTFGKVLGEGAYGAVSTWIWHTIFFVNMLFPVLFERD